MIQACPNCDSSTIEVASTKKFRDDDAPDYYCSDCGSGFDTPVEREPKGPSKLNGLAKKLAEANPEDL